MWKRTYLFALCVVFAGQAAAQQQPAAGEADPLGRQNPRSTVLNFLRTADAGNYRVATEYLEGTDSRDTGRRLKSVLDNSPSINLDSISAAPEGDLTDGLPQDQERIGSMPVNGEAVDILLRRVSDGAAGPVWMFASETLSRIPAAYRELAPVWVERFLPVSLVSSEFRGVQAWKWLALLILAPVAYVVGWLIGISVLWGAGLLSRRTSTGLDDSVVEILKGPLRLFIAVLIFRLGTLFLALPLLFRQRLGHLELVIGVFALVWFGVRAVDLASSEVRQLMIQTQRTAAISMVPLGRRIAKVMVWILALLVILDNAGFDLRAILTGLGVGGIAVALAAQKTLENIFGGIALVLDQPVRVGDFCKYGDSIGIVEDIGLRSTRIRSLDRTVVSVPNGQFSTLNLENFAMREKMWFHPAIRLRIDTTPDQVRYVLAEIRKVLYEHARVEPGGRVRLTGFGEDALKLEIFSYVCTADYGEFVAIQEDLLLRILEVIEGAGTSLAAPTQTTLISRDRGVREDRTSVTLETVKQWKQGRRMPFPDFSPDEIAAMRNRLPYPPQESVLGDGKA